MGQGLKTFSSSELSCRWPKVAETMTVADIAVLKQVLEKMRYDLFQ
jgi:hypothetical protein